MSTRISDTPVCSLTHSAAVFQSLNVLPIIFHYTACCVVLNFFFLRVSLLSSKFQPHILEQAACNDCTLFELGTVADCHSLGVLAICAPAHPYFLVNFLFTSRLLCLYIIDLGIHGLQWLVANRELFIFCKAIETFVFSIFIFSTTLILSQFRSAIIFCNSSLSLLKSASSKHAMNNMERSSLHV